MKIIDIPKAKLEEAIKAYNKDNPDNEVTIMYKGGNIYLHSPKTPIELIKLLPDFFTYNPNNNDHP